MTATVIVGAGLAGLACARRLAAAGRDVVVLEADDDVGGRVRTDVVDGFRLDRGFQVLLTGYPAARAQLDLAALDLQPFRAGVVIRCDGRMQRLADPLREPVAALGGLSSSALTLLDGLRLLRLRARVQGPDGRTVAERQQQPTIDALADAGFSQRAIERFFRPFLAGVFLDPDLTMSSRMFELVLRSFFAGRAAVPAAGMGALTQQLAAALPLGSVRLSTPVAAVHEGAVVTASGERIEASDVVVATDGPTASRLLRGAVEVPPGLGTATVWWAADRSPVGGADLVLDGDRTGPVNNLAVLSDVAPSYAPEGRSLVAGSVVGVPAGDDAALDAAARRQLRVWYGAEVDGWRVLRIDRIPWAQPRQQVQDLSSLARPVGAGPGLWVCGDHRDTASIQGALVSGRRTADVLLGPGHDAHASERGGRDT